MPRVASNPQRLPILFASLFCNRDKSYYNYFILLIIMYLYKIMGEVMFQYLYRVNGLHKLFSGSTDF